MDLHKVNSKRLRVSLRAFGGGGGQAFTPTTISPGQVGQETGAFAKNLSQFQTTGNPYLQGLFGGFQNTINPMIQSGGALAPEQYRAATQSAYSDASNLGMAHSLGAIGASVLKRFQLQQQNFNTAIGQAQNIFTTGVAGFSPLLSAAINVLGFNANAQNAASIAGANQSAGNKSGIESAGGAVVGGALTAL